MGGILARIVPIVIQMLAGLGLGEILDKAAPDQVKAYIPEERPKTM